MTFSNLFALRLTLVVALTGCVVEEAAEPTAEDPDAVCHRDDWCAISGSCHVTEQCGCIPFSQSECEQARLCWDPPDPVAGPQCCLTTRASDGCAVCGPCPR